MQLYRFNTVNGKHCCNKEYVRLFSDDEDIGFNTVNGKHCCNDEDIAMEDVRNMKVSIP